MVFILLSYIFCFCRVLLYYPNLVSLAFQSHDLKKFFSSWFSNSFMDYQNFLKRFYTYSFFKDFSFAYAIWVLLPSVRGLSVLEISATFVVWCVTVVLLEVPSGALADKWSRKGMITISQFLKALAFLVWFFAGNVWLFSLGFIFFGAYGAFYSGTQDALLFDSLKKFGKSKYYEKVLGKSNLFYYLGMGVAMFLGGFIAAVSLDLTVFLSIIFALFVMLVTLPLPNVRAVKSTGEVKYFDNIKIALKESVSNRKLLILLLFSAIVITSLGVVDEYEQLYLNWVGFPVLFFGAWASFIMVLQGAGGFLAHRFKRLVGWDSSIYFLGVFAGFCLVVAVVFRSLWVLPVYAFTYFLYGVIEVIVGARLQKAIKSHTRATISSVNSLLMNFSAIFFMGFFGLLSEPFGLAGGLLFLSFLAIIPSVVLVLVKKFLVKGL